MQKNISESSIKENCKKKLTASGWLVIHLIQTNINGVADTLIIKQGRHVFLEFKKDGKGFEPLQKYRRRQLVKFGAEVYKIDNVNNIAFLL